ncbi:MAG: hypothetical protein HQ508_08215 [Candidatus Marinimicrobia bacterium]|nr:hypothetical protein [Candidatus Neomarinimicrobiota bacterium]
MNTRLYNRSSTSLCSLLIAGLIINASASPISGPDSVQLVIHGDTLKAKQLYTLEFPPYAPIQDSLHQDANQKVRKSDVQPENGLAATGSISRGIQVSSGASVSLQSSMYLNINGNLSEDYTVSGVLTDQTSPLQPIGNTRRLNDFDRVMVSVNGPALNASIGDIDLRLNNGRFGKIERSIEGITFEGRSGHASVNSALGFSYGKYHLQLIQGKDGKQGPYRLSGKNGEKFIIVLAGSEKIKLDDELMQRGEHDDYIIDYNAAEIYFTQKRILSSNSRISIEFEYVPDIYLASYSFGKQLVSGGISLGEKEKTGLYASASWLQLKDDQRNPLGNIETDVLENIFSNLADTVATAWVNGIVLDTLNGSYDFNQSGDLVFIGVGQGRYAVEFSYVGLAQGTYRKELGGSGNYFVHDTLTGEYLPAQKYFAPQSRSVFSLSTGAHVGLFEIDLDLGLSEGVNNLYASSNVSQTQVAWDLSLSRKGENLELDISDKYYESGFVSLDALETLEYYRLWQLTPRIEEEERLNSSLIRIGVLSESFLSGSISRLSRSGSRIGEQVRLVGKTNPGRALKGEISSSITTRDTSTSQTHNFKSTLETGHVTTEFNLNIEDGARGGYYVPNNHLKTGVGAAYKWSAAHIFNLMYDRRMDYRLDSEGTTYLSSEGIRNWSELRQDWSSEYTFSELLNSQGLISFKYRELRNDSNTVNNYFLGNFQLQGKALDNQLRFQQSYLIDEEHIPKYDYHYIEVDTGYGDYSYDPLIMDYIPMDGGRFARQRVFSDIEEQVRKYENKTRVEYSSEQYGKPEKRGFKSKLGYESKLKLQVDTKSTIQSQELISLDLFYQTGRKDFFRELNYSGKTTANRSTLYNYGREANDFNSHQFDAELFWNAKNRSKIGLLYEARGRDIEYNVLARENWISYRPYAEYTLQINPSQKLTMLIKRSQVEDLHDEQTYNENFLGIDHSLRIRQRGRIDQKLTVSQIEANVSGIPYSIFSGRQPGDNWRYSMNARYTFSSRFQLSMNYSIQKRGEIQAEQFLRVEGRTHF